MNPPAPYTPENHQPLLVLDLDETLIHSAGEQLEGLEEAFQVFEYHVHRRPGLENFLRTVFAHFKVAVWTSADYEYARQIVKQIFPPQYTLEYMWAREECTLRYIPERQEHHYHKNFKKLKKRGWNLDHIIAIDDSPEKHVTQYGNLVPIHAWTGETDDNDLSLLSEYLVNELLPRIESGESVRSFEKRFWKSAK